MVYIWPDNQYHAHLHCVHTLTPDLAQRKRAPSRMPILGGVHFKSGVNIELYTGWENVTHVSFT